MVEGHLRPWPADLAARRLGDALAGFPAGSAFVSHEREALAYAGSWSCLHPGFPEDDTAEPLVTGLRLVPTNCPGEGDLYWVVSPAPDPRRVHPARATLDQDVAARDPEVLGVGAGGTRFTVHRVPRSSSM